MGCMCQPINMCLCVNTWHWVSETQSPDYTGIRTGWVFMIGIVLYFNFIMYVQSMINNFQAMVDQARLVMWQRLLWDWKSCVSSCANMVKLSEVCEQGCCISEFSFLFNSNFSLSRRHFFVWICASFVSNLVSYFCLYKVS